MKKTTLRKFVTRKLATAAIVMALTVTVPVTADTWYVEPDIGLWVTSDIYNPTENRTEAIPGGTAVEVLGIDDLGWATVMYDGQVAYTQSWYLSNPGQYQEPTYQEPVYQEPTYQEPVYQEPTYQEPVYQEPTYQEPVYQEQYQDTAYQEPVYQQPTCQETQYQEPVAETTYKNTVLVDLQNQNLRCYSVRGELVMDVAIISGNPNNGNETPVGEYTIRRMESNAILRGADYEAPVQYWMPFVENMVGFHDASWQYDYSNESYLTNGSHGCVNMKPEDAAELWNNISIGTKVIVY